MANYQVDNLEITIKSKADEAILSLNTLIAKVTELKVATGVAFGEINSQGITQNFNTVVQGTQRISNITKEYTKQNETSNKSLFQSVLRSSLFVVAMKKTAGAVKTATETAMGYVETANLFSVTFGKNTASALKFQQTMNKMYGTNIEETMKYQAVFNQLGIGMGIANDTALVLSENLTKIGLDLSSLFNVKQGDAMQKLEAGLVGQTKPLRSLGIDITFATLQPLADQLGLKEQVKNMSQAEKMILRYIAILKQASNAQGDLARTIEMPANQFRVLKNQAIELSRAIGAFFLQAFGAALPYLNAVLMALKEIFMYIAKIFNIDLNAYMVDIESTGLATGLGADMEDAANNIGDAADNAQKLKDNLQGFDELNVIQQQPTQTGGGGVGGIGSGIISPKLLDEMKKYNSVFDKIKMRATEIKDEIMNWLGFDTEGNLKDGYTNLKKIRDIALAIGMIFVGWKLTNLLSDLVKAISKMTTLQSLGLAITIGITLGYLIATNIDEIAPTVTQMFADSFGMEYKDGSFIYKMYVNVQFMIAAIAVGLLRLFGIDEKEATNFLKNLGDLILVGTPQWKEAWVKVFDVSMEEWKKLLNRFATETTVGNFLKNLGDLILAGTPQGKEAWRKVFDISIQEWQKILNWFATSTTVGNFLKNIGDLVLAGTPQGQEAWGKVWDTLKRGSQTAFDKMKEKGKEAWSEIKSLGKEVGTTFGHNVESSFRSVMNWIISKINAIGFKIQDFVLRSANLLNGLGFNIPIKIFFWGIPAYATGGMPEDGLFVANHNELVGQFSNGKTAVANNEQIISGIRSGVEAGIRAGLGGGNSNQPISIQVKIGEDTLINRVIGGINKEIRQRNEFVFDIPS